MPRSRQRGMALITGLLLLMVLTILALSMFRSYGTQQKIAVNVREKQRAVSAAVSAQQSAEYWLNNNPPPVAADCTGMGVSGVNQVCLASPAPNFINVPWMLSGQKVGVTFTNFNSTVTVPNGSNVKVNQTTPSQASYYGTPVYYVTDLGPAAAGPATGEVYQIDATGWGGTADTVAVVESTFLLPPSGRNYDK